MSSYLELQLSDSIHPRVKIEMPLDSVSLEAVLDDLIKPALLASGFQQGSVDKIIIEEEEL